MYAVIQNAKMGYGYIGKRKTILAKPSSNRRFFSGGYMEKDYSKGIAGFMVGFSVGIITVMTIILLYEKLC